MSWFVSIRSVLLKWAAPALIYLEQRVISQPWRLHILIHQLEPSADYRRSAGGEHLLKDTTSHLM